MTLISRDFFRAQGPMGELLGLDGSGTRQRRALVLTERGTWRNSAPGSCAMVGGSTLVKMRCDGP